MLIVDTGGIELVCCFGLKRMSGGGREYPAIPSKEVAQDLEAVEFVF